MSRYRKVDPKIWNDAKFMALSSDAKLVFLFLLTHPHMTALGAMRANVPGLAVELGMGVEAFREAFRECFREGCGKPLVEYDERHSLVSLPNFIRYNKPESPNVVRAWFSAVDLIPECELKAQIIRRAQAFAEGFGKAFAEAFAEGSAKPLGKTMPNQKQKQKQKPKQKKKPPTPFAGLAPDDEISGEQISGEDKKQPEQKIVNRQNGCDSESEIIRQAIEHLNLKTGSRFTTAPSNAKFISARLAEGVTLNDLKNVIDVKTRQWLNDPNMSQYLRPATLFNAEKFHQYLGQVGCTPSASAQDEVNQIFSVSSSRTDDINAIDAEYMELNR